MTRGAVWDLGSSSFQVLVCDIGPHQSLRPVLKRRSLLNLGLDVGTKGTISPERAIASVAAAKRLRRALGTVNPQIVVALATAALRDANNGPEVVARLEKAVGTPIRTLDGKQEARLCFAGQRAGVYVDEGPTLGIDLGGGSFELAIGDRFEIYSVASAPIGATRLQGELGVGQVLSRDDRKEVRERVREAFEVMDLRLEHYPGAASRVVLSGGTARALARLAMARTRGGAGATAFGVNQVELARGQVAELAAMLAHLDLRQRRALPGMPARRAPVLPVGACILQAIADELGIDYYVVSEWGLREGALLEAAAEFASPGETCLRGA